MFSLNFPSHICCDTPSQLSVFMENSFPIRIRRDFVFEDAFDALSQLEDSAWKRTIRVELIGSSGFPEAGIDGGGLFKEFLTVLVKTAFNTEYALFKETSERKLYPNPSSALIIKDSLEHFEFLGKILGKAVFENILVELPLANFFLAKLLHKFNYVNDLYFLDPSLHKNLMFLKTCDNVEDLSLTFSVVENEFGESKVIDLIPGGRDISVNNENRIKYIAYMANFRLNIQIKHQSAAFLRGFSRIISPDLIQMFNQDEFQTIISGQTSSIDLVDMRIHTNYSGGYYDTHPVIEMFWRVMCTFSIDDQHQFLMFVTSCSRPPLLGFKSLHPAFCIHQAIHDANLSSENDEFLPTASTCMNFLKLPPYSSQSKMREKILYAIHSRAGFELS